MKNLIKKISIVIPCYNEIGTIEIILKKVEDFLTYYEKEVIIVDDFSSDGTREFLKKYKFEDINYKILFNDKNRGKGFSVKQGIEASTGELILIQDADLEYNPNDFSKVIKVFENYDADVVYGSRFNHSEVSRVLYFRHYLGNKILTLLSNLLTDLNLTDMETGIKGFKSSKLKTINLEEYRFGFEPEVTAKLNNIKCKFYEVGISYNGRSYEEGKKITWKDGFSAIRCIFKYNIWKKF